MFPTVPRDYLDWKADGIGRNILYLGLIGTISFAIVLISEAKLIEKILFWRTRQVADAPISGRLTENWHGTNGVSKKKFFG